MGRGLLIRGEGCSRYGRRAYATIMAGLISDPLYSHSEPDPQKQELSAILNPCSLRSYYAAFSTCKSGFGDVF